MKRGLALFLAALTVSLVLTACGGAGGNDSPGATAAASGSGSGYIEDHYAGGGEWGWDYEVEAPAVDSSAQEEANRGETDSRLANAKMVYTASLEAETQDFEACTAALEALVEDLGGYLEYASAGSYGDGFRSGSYTVRVPAARFQDFLQAVGNIGHVIQQERNADNISEMYYDTESRLTTQRTKMERLQALLARAENMEDIITLESAIAETELEIEQLTGSLRHYDALVDFATVSLRLREVVRLSTVEETPPTFASRLGNAFLDGLHGFRIFLQGLAILLAYNWTWILILVLIVLLAVCISRQKQNRRGEAGVQRESGIFRRKGDGPKNPDDKQP